MGSRHLGLVRKGCLSALGLILAMTLAGTTAEARHHSRHMRRFAGHLRHHHGTPVASPGFAAMVVDANTGHTLYASNENAPRHPASITKVMTLYLLFEKLDAGDMRLDTRIGVSAHAASMAPTKLGLRPGSTIAVEDAIKAIVTKSANDMAVAVAESIGGDEASFAAMMTRKAHALGMSRTTYVNASGLPDDRQITTAHDLTILGRVVHDRFPRYYRYFSTPSFTYAGSFMPNHNHLMSRIEGMDGIKTGYTRASGFNLLSSVSRDGHRIVSVVLGGHTAASRDRIMASLIEDHIDEGAATRVASADIDNPIEAPSPTVESSSYGRSAQFEAQAQPQPQPERDAGPSLIAPTLAVPPMPVNRPNDRARTPAQMASAGSPIERLRPAFIAGAPQIDPARAASADRRHLAEDGSTSSRPSRATSGPLATATPSTLKAAPKSAVVLASLAMPAPMPVARPDIVQHIRSEESRAVESLPKTRAAAHGDWIIQIGAPDDPEKATDLLNRARNQGAGALASARPFTEKVRKGDATLYRARFAGLDTTEAEQACKALKRSGFACFATKD